MPSSNIDAHKPLMAQQCTSRPLLQCSQLGMVQPTGAAHMKEEQPGCDKIIHKKLRSGFSLEKMQNLISARLAAQQPAIASWLPAG